jgi:energy-coupling factor transport system permease protein
MLGSVAIPLFTGVFRHAETLSAAMDARCYHGEQGRTRLHALTFGREDALAALAMALLVTCVVVINLQLV